MQSSQQFVNEEDLVTLSKQGYFAIMLDENLRVLESALEDDGFKVVVPHQGLKDEAAVAGNTVAAGDYAGRLHLFDLRGTLI